MALVGDRRIDVSIAENDFGRTERGFDHLTHMLRSVGDVQQQFRLR
jgi:hypothetical protein